MFDKIAAKVNNIDTKGFVLKTKYDTDWWWLPADRSGIITHQFFLSFKDWANPYKLEKCSDLASFNIFKIMSW